MDDRQGFRALYANAKGQILDYPGMGMLGRSAMEWVEPLREEMIPLPRGAVLVSIPGQRPVAGEAGRAVVIKNAPGGGAAQAVGALLPQGFTRTLFPAGVSPDPHNVLPLFGYAAVGFRDEKIWVAAVQSDEHRKWHPRFYNTVQLPAYINRLQRKYPENRILKQLSHCALNYGCYTAQNIFYRRWEGGIPTMRACNADCIGCISEGHEKIDSPQQRLGFQPSVEEISQVGSEHLAKAREGIISFGQGCEGEPSLNAVDIAAAISRIRCQTDRGTININTNAGYTEGIIRLCRAGLDAMRVTIFSCRQENYQIYHRPKNYRWDDVGRSVSSAKEAGLDVSLNLLVFPGFTDREEEIEALLAWVKQKQVDMIQLRNLNIDPDLLFRHVPDGGTAIGISNFLYVLQQELPAVRIGSYTHPVKTEKARPSERQITS
ncbi:MAG: radical SAM protein [Syntrophomonadaceae bacterium]|nr:radical SAM protein [Syntrophomonadaceae bacterium]